MSKIINVKYEKFFGENAKIGADLALKNKLFVSGWELSRELQSIRKGTSPYDVVCVATVDNKPVTVVITDKQGRQLPMAFTSKSYRKKGIAKTLINKTKVKVRFGDEGIDGSLVFWHKVHNV